MKAENKELPNPFETNLTNTSLFLLPPLQLDGKELYNNGFWNAYLGDEDHDVAYEEGQLLYCLFKPNNEYLFEKMLEELEEKGLVVDDYDYEEGFCVIVLRFPSKYDSDFKLITQSKYSKTSKEFQKLFPMEVERMVASNVKEITKSVYHNVFNKDENFLKHIQDYFGIDYNDSYEYWPRFEEKPHILSIDRFVKNIKV